MPLNSPSLHLDQTQPILPQLVDHTIILSMEIQALIADRYGNLGWQADLSEPATFWFTSEPPAIFRPHFIGSSSGDSNSWLWGWDNVNEFPDAVVDIATQVQAIGEQLNVRELTTAHQTLDPDEREAEGLVTIEAADQALLFAAMALSGLEAPAYYRGPTGGGSFAWFLLDNPAEFSLPTPTVLAMTSAITHALSSGYLTHHRLGVQAYAERRQGVALAQDGTALLLTASDGTVRVDFDEHGRIGKVSGSAGK